MSAVLSRPHFTFEDYLAWEETQTERHEYIGGQVFARTGSSTTHNIISGNAAIALRTQTRGTPCRVYMADVRLHVQAADASFYPDVFVTCSAADAERRSVQQDALLIVEVLSPSTEGHDRGDKFAAYRLLPSLQAVVFVAQGQPHVEAFTRNADGSWTLFEASGLDAQLTCATAERSFVFPLAELYAEVDFSAASAEASTESAAKTAAASSGTSA
ncbi:MAG: Uma2 family endonuclease [Thiomonas sp.]|uniref:Uma2 family endonuclease n=1 Tax=Thiomonas sp. TaxID=2047785 RepID=UPI002A369955|nr:Uma2 family endonuclease [Thiomonas sp.]MDY0330944.1 Uma2 family endonuclease [Thiomonas sp.]